MSKDLFLHVSKWAVVAIIAAIFSTVITSRELKGRVSSLEAQRKVEARLLCKIAIKINALDKKQDPELNNACASLIGI